MHCFSQRFTLLSLLFIIVLLLSHTFYSGHKKKKHINTVYILSLTHNLAFSSILFIKKASKIVHMKKHTSQMCPTGDYRK